MKKETVAMVLIRKIQEEDYESAGMIWRRSTGKCPLRAGMLLML